MLARLFEAIGKLDGALFQELREHHTALADTVMYTLSEAARGNVLWIVLGVVLALAQPKRWSGVWQFILAIGLSALLANMVGKPLAGRARPFQTFAETRVVGSRPSSASFPSGHAANAFAAAYALTRVVPQARVIFWAIALLVAYSRIYLGVHYPLDVIVGAVIGLAAAVLAIGGSRWDDG